MTAALSEPDASLAATPATPHTRLGRLRRWGRRRLPALLLGVVLALVALFVATQTRTYGHSFDEDLQDQYGRAVLRWYTSFGSNRSFLHFPVQFHMQQHGPFFETVIAAAERITGHRWYVRSVVCGIAGGIGIVGIALCGLELAGWWTALAAAVGLALYPRYTGAIFNNSKDVPLTVAMIFVLWLSLRLIHRWRGSVPRMLLESALLGVALGAAMSIRINALLWYPVLGGCVACWWLWHLVRTRDDRAARRLATLRGLLARQVAAGAVIVLVSYVTMLALWPYLALHPRYGLIESIRVMSEYDWTGVVLFDGITYHATDLPHRYAPEWLAIGSPPATVALAVVGGGFLVADAARRRLPDPGALLAAALLVVPVAAIVVLHSTVYNGLRHFLFAVPGMILLAALGLVRLVGALRRPDRPLLAGSVIALVLLAQAQVVVEVVRLRPFEYLYLSPVVGGFPHEPGRYELDYWRTCETQLVRWLNPRVREYTDVPRPTFPSLLVPTAQAELAPPLVAKGPGPADFIVTGWDGLPPDAHVVRNGYLRLHAISREGATICALNIRLAALRR